MKKIALFLVVALALTSCHRPILRCRTEYIYPIYLASERINTPDPCRLCYYGQQLIVHWNLPRVEGPVTLQLEIRYGSREVETLNISIEKRAGWFIHKLINQDYWCKGGILSFRARLLQGENIIDEWKHYLWADLIEINPECD